MLEFFFPGFSRVSPVLQRYTGINLDAVVPVLCLCGLLIFLYKHGYQDVSNWVQKHLSESVLQEVSSLSLTIRSLDHSHSVRQRSA
jgi:hypothetical protein